MKNLTLKAIAQATGGQLVYPDNYEVNESMEVAGVINDNRGVQPGYLFVPMVGARVDGHDFIADAAGRGACATLSQRSLTDPIIPYILVDDTKLALKQIATYYRQQLTIPVIGVVGSVGKTSTKEMLASVLGVHFNVLKTEGNFNNEIGLPLTICRIRDEHQVAVVEMGISDFGEMHRLGDMARPDFVVMTNIGQCHLEFLKTRDGILKAKTEVFEHMPPTGTVVLNGDDDKLINADTLGLKKIFYGTHGQEISARDIAADGITGTRALFNARGTEFTVTIPLPGEHNVMNGLAAIAVALELGMSIDEIKQGLAQAATIAGRNNVIKAGQVTIIDDCYNANPVSMRASIEVLSKAEGRTVAVLGDMGELGADEKQLHYGLGQALNDNNIDVCFTAGSLSAEIARALSDMDSSCQSHHFDTAEAMLPQLLDFIKPGDTVLVKASHFMQFGKIVDALKAKLQ